MINLKIKSRVLGETIEFTLSSDGYVMANLGNGNWCQICHGSDLMGSTISARKASFEKVCRAWYRGYLARERDLRYKDVMLW